MAIFLFLALSVGLSATGIYTCLRARRFSGSDWESLIAQIQPVPFAGIESVALEHLQPNDRQLHLGPDEMWELVGGLDGLRRMRRNANLIIQLAAYVQRWNFEESVIVAERIRHDAIILKRALFRIQLQILFSFYKLRVPFYVPQAAASYYLMTRRVLALYQTNQFVLFPRLAEVL
jgi:hypothetical protein